MPDESFMESSRRLEGDCANARIHEQMMCQALAPGSRVDRDRQDRDRWPGYEKKNRSPLPIQQSVA